MGRGTSITLEELGWIKGAIARIEAIKASRSTRYSRPVWEYVCDFTGRSEKCVKAIKRKVKKDYACLFLLKQNAQMEEPGRNRI